MCRLTCRSEVCGHGRGACGHKRGAQRFADEVEVGGEGPCGEDAAVDGAHVLRAEGAREVGRQAREEAAVEGDGRQRAAVKEVER